MYSGIMRKDDNRTSKSLSGRSVTYKLSGFIIKTGDTDNGTLFFYCFLCVLWKNYIFWLSFCRFRKTDYFNLFIHLNFFILNACITDSEEKLIP